MGIVLVPADNAAGPSWLDRYETTGHHQCLVTNTYLTTETENNGDVDLDRDNNVDEHSPL
jgi:hypothetical protein